MNDDERSDDFITTDISYALFLLGCTLCEERRKLFPNQRIPLQLHVRAATM